MAVIPVKDLRGTKSRLAPLLDSGAKAGLTIYMMRRVIRALLDAGVGEVCVVSPDGIVLGEAEGVGATALRQASRGLNEALDEGRELALEKGFRSLLVVPADLPLVEAADLRGLLESSEGFPVVISPDGARTGTNALLLSPPSAISFGFGEGSFGIHTRRAREAGLSCRVYENDHLSFDLDTAEDLAELDLPGGYGG